jgi:hypothetical protein
VQFAKTAQYSSLGRHEKDACVLLLMPLVMGKIVAFMQKAPPPVSTVRLEIRELNAQRVRSSNSIWVTAGLDSPLMSKEDNQTPSEVAEAPKQRVPHKTKTRMGIICVQQQLLRQQKPRKLAEE